MALSLARIWRVIGPCVAVCLAACQAPGASASAPADTVKTESVYDRATGRLQILKADTDGNGTMDALAHMDGTRLRDIELDRDGDGQPDRWEYYEPGTPDQPTGNRFDRWALIVRAEEARRPGASPTRREFYARGIIERVEEDTDLDGRVDKWERYERGELRELDLDLAGRGAPTQRLVYGPGGDVIRVEQDRDGDGRFDVVPEVDHR